MYSFFTFLFFSHPETDFYFICIYIFCIIVIIKKNKLQIYYKFIKWKIKSDRFDLIIIICFYKKNTKSY